MKTIAIYSNKGGVGKTATAVNLSYLAAQAGYKTLICDLDPQSSTTYYFRVKPKLKGDTESFVKERKIVSKSIKGTDYDGLDLLPADFALRNLDVTLDKMKKSETRLQRMLKGFRKEYDLVIIDSPPTINILAENIFNAAQYLLVPLIPTVLSLRTHQQLLRLFKAEKYDASRVYSFCSMVDRRKKMHVALVQQLSEEFQGVLSAVIPYLSDVERMGLQREPVPAFAPNSPAAKAYQALWAEVHQTILQ